MSVWTRMGRWLDSFFGGAEHSPELDPARVDAAIRLIQGAVDDEERARQARKLKVSDLNDERQSQLAQELARLLKKPPTK
jgi:uncharacterized membrane protein YebE (DUF533 family)